MLDHDVAIPAPADNHEVTLDRDRGVAVFRYQFCLHEPLGQGAEIVLRDGCIIVHFTW